MCVRLKELGERHRVTEWIMYADGVAVHWTPECLGAINSFSRDTSHPYKLSQLSCRHIAHGSTMLWHLIQHFVDQEQPWANAAARIYYDIMMVHTAALS